MINPLNLPNQTASQSYHWTWSPQISASCETSNFSYRSFQTPFRFPPSILALYHIITDTNCSKSNSFSKLSLNVIAPDLTKSYDISNFSLFTIYVHTPYPSTPYPSPFTPISISNTTHSSESNSFSRLSLNVIAPNLAASCETSNPRLIASSKPHFASFPFHPYLISYYHKHSLFIIEQFLEIIAERDRPKSRGVLWYFKLLNAHSKPPFVSSPFHLCLISYNHKYSLFQVKQLLEVIAERDCAKSRGVLRDFEFSSQVPPP